MKPKELNFTENSSSYKIRHKSRTKQQLIILFTGNAVGVGWGVVWEPTQRLLKKLNLTKKKTPNFSIRILKPIWVQRINTKM